MMDLKLREEVWIDWNFDQGLAIYEKNLPEGGGSILQSYEYLAHAESFKYS